MRQVKPDGSVTTATALAAFALAIGPVPGAVVPAGPDQEIISGTIAIRWIERHWNDLSAAQHGAILSDLGVDPATNKPASYVDAPPAVRAPSKVPPEIPCQTEDGGNAGKFRAMIPGIESAIATNLRRPLTIDKGTFVVVNDKHVGKPLSLLYTVPCRDGAGNMIGCTFHINPEAGGHSDADMRDFFIHEMMHCFMYEKYNTAYSTMLDWFAEGQAAWAASVLGTANSVLDNQWESYLDTSTGPLMIRHEDGIGFFVHLAESGIDPWAATDRMADALKVSNTDEAAWAAAGITPAFLNTWGTGPVAGRYPGSA
jgi:hypothetical protein